MVTLWPRRNGGAACLLPICRWIGYKGQYAGICLYVRQRVRIICGEDRKDESSDMVWVKRIIIVLVVGFFLFYLIAQPEAAANAVRALFQALARVFRSIITFFQSLAG
jgi:hypothetical protein